MTMSRDELTIEQLLSDPVTRAVMEADGVDPSELEAMLRSMATAIERAANRRSKEFACKGDGAQSRRATAHSSLRSQLCGAP
jgi:hypothetical protein